MRDDEYKDLQDEDEVEITDQATSPGIISLLHLFYGIPGQLMG
jgi:hypothetical protein